jgi:hypothetical protein
MKVNHSMELKNKQTNKYGEIFLIGILLDIFVELNYSLFITKSKGIMFYGEDLYRLLPAILSISFIYE